jgi:hypothetical protein
MIRKAPTDMAIKKKESHAIKVEPIIKSATNNKNQLKCNLLVYSINGVKCFTLIEVEPFCTVKIVLDETG